MIRFGAIAAVFLGVWWIAGGRRLVSITGPTRREAVLTGCGLLVGGVAGGPAIVLTPVAAAAVPALVVRVSRSFGVRRRRRDTLDRWPDLLAMVRGRLATGTTLPDAVRHAGRSVGGPFEALDRPWGGDFGGALRTLQAQWEDPVADRVFTTLRLAAAIGGGRVDTMLGSLAVSLSDEIRIRRMHRAAVSQQQITAGVALLAPWLILGLSLATNPQAAAAFGSDAGRSILWLGGAATSAGYLAARRATRLSDPPRLFR